MLILICLKRGEKRGRKRRKWREGEVPPLKVPRQCPLLLLLGGEMLGCGLCYVEERSLSWGFTAYGRN
jgi:hypothetical protein